MRSEDRMLPEAGASASLNVRGADKTIEGIDPRSSESVTEENLT